MRRVNVVECELEEVLERGEFRHAESTLTERLGSRLIGASVYEMQAADAVWPYHYHHGVEEWLYVISGAPMLRDSGGDRGLEPGDLVACPSGPRGAHTVRGPGRIVIFSAGASGWGESFVTVYPDSDKIGAAPGVMFRRGDALDSWHEEPDETSELVDAQRRLAAGRSSLGAVNLRSVAAHTSLDNVARGRDRVQCTAVGALLGAQTWAATLFEIGPGDATTYRYEWCREEWLLVLGGAPTLRHPDGEDALDGGDVICFPEGPAGAHQLLNHSQGTVRLIIFSTPRDRPTSAFYPDEGTVVVRISDHEGFVFRLNDQIDDYWDGEPGADVT